MPSVRISSIGRITDVTIANNTYAQGANHERGENRVNPEEQNSDISWVQFIGALLFIPVFFISIILFSIIDLFGANRSSGIMRGQNDREI